MSRATCIYRDRRGRDRCTECSLHVDLCLCSDPDELAHQRLSTEENLFLREVSQRVGEIKKESSHLFEELVQEVGIVGTALVSHNKHRTPAPDVIAKNLITVAALATRLAVSGTEEYSFPES